MVLQLLGVEVVNEGAELLDLDTALGRMVGNLVGRLPLEPHVVRAHAHGPHLFLLLEPTDRVGIFRARSLNPVPIVDPIPIASIIVIVLFQTVGRAVCDSCRKFSQL